jgi:hypothetical protein
MRLALFTLALLASASAHTDGLTKADIAEAVAEGLGTVLDCLVHKVDRLFTHPPEKEPDEVNVTFFEIIDDFAANEFKDQRLAEIPPYAPVSTHSDALPGFFPPNLKTPYLKRPHSTPQAKPEPKLQSKLQSKPQSNLQSMLQALQSKLDKRRRASTTGL